MRLAKISVTSVLLSCVLLAMVLVTNQTQVRATTTGPSFSLGNSALTVKPGDIFTTPVILNTDGQAVEGAGARINYDSTTIKVLSVQPGTLFSDYPIAGFDNSKGLVSISAIVSNPNESYTGTDVLATVTWQLVQAQPTTIAFDFVPGSTTDSNIAVKTGNGDILNGVTNLAITPGTVTVATINTPTGNSGLSGTSALPNGVNRSSAVTAVPPVSGPIATTLTKIKIMSSNLLNDMVSLLTRLFGGSTVDPYSSLKPQAPQTNLQISQPDSTLSVSNSSGAQTIQASEVKPALWPLVVAGIALVALLIAVIVMLIRRKPTSEIQIDTVYQPPVPPNASNPPPLA